MDTPSSDLWLWDVVYTVRRPGETKNRAFFQLANGEELSVEIKRCPRCGGAANGCPACS